MFVNKGFLGSLAKLSLNAFINDIFISIIISVYGASTFNIEWRW